MTSEPKRVVKRRPRSQPRYPVLRCSCGDTEVHLVGGKAIVKGKGWCKENQWVVCGSCSMNLRYAPMLVWETPDGSQYSTRGYLAEGASRQVQ